MHNKKILKHTLALYLRQIVIVLISLYTLRVVLTELGVEDYSIYSVVAGFVTLLAFLPGTMASATQRFFSFAMGQQDSEKLKQTFSVHWLLYAAIALLAFAILQSIGLWFVTEHLSIPEHRADAAVSLYQMVVLSFVASIFSSPFIAILIAHEDMHLFALISVIDAVLKLVAALALAVVGGDALELYGLFLLIAAVITTSAYIFICVRKYAECQFRKIYCNKTLLKEIVDFTGWTLVGQISMVFRNQAVTVFVNQLFNPTTAAARAIALQLMVQRYIAGTGPRRRIGAWHSFKIRNNTPAKKSIVYLFNITQCLELFSTRLPAVALEQYPSDRTKAALQGISKKIVSAK